ncbi:diguanylate cyclase [Vibrio sp. 10N.261.52.C2]|uniref:TackOD1 domain-containing metal-binding protein n=1 Tax=Vibrio sp. 10N.261.52.C2 TaxID=3229681 RepID=UPI00354CF118
MRDKLKIYCLGTPIVDAEDRFDIAQVSDIEQLPELLGGVVFLNTEASVQDDLLSQLHRCRKFWSWKIYVFETSALSVCLSDGVLNQDTIEEELTQHSRTLNSVSESTDALDPLIGWLGLEQDRRLVPHHSLTLKSIYSYPLVDLYYPELSSTYRFVLSETKRDTFEYDELINRIRVCSDCASAHLNYIEVCPSCKDIDITERVSLHCFTCGHVAEQGQFKRNHKLECPKCLTQLRHIGVDYDRPLETHSCNVCSHSFSEAETLAVCFSCDAKNDVSQLVVRKIYSLKLGVQGEYIFRHGVKLSAPQLTLRGKVDSGYFSNLLDWVNRIAIRHQEEHLLLGLHLPDLAQYVSKNGDAKMFALIEQITERLNGLFRDSDICCQYKSDVLFVFMPKAKMEHINVLREKIEALCLLIEDDDFTLNVFAWSLPDPMVKEDVGAWLESKVGEIYAVE